MLEGFDSGGSVRKGVVVSVLVAREHAREKVWVRH